MKEKRPVLPGEEVAVVEEFLPADGTFEEDSKVYAALMGELELDLEEKTATVKAINPMVELEQGDLVFCAVTDVRSAMAICEVVAKEGKERNITGDTNGTIHISKLSTDYVQDVGREPPSQRYHPGKGHSATAVGAIDDRRTASWRRKGALPSMPRPAGPQGQGAVV